MCLLLLQLCCSHLTLPVPYTVATQIRAAHIQVPDYSAYKREDGKDVQESAYSRRAFTYALGAGGTVVAAHMAKNIVQDFLDTMSASVCSRGACEEMQGGVA